MKGKYQSIFLIPLESEKVLTDLGWVFKSENSLENEIQKKLISRFNLDKKENYDGFNIFTNHKELEMSVELDDMGRILVIHIKDYSEGLSHFIGDLKDLLLCDEVEIYNPAP